MGVKSFIPFLERYAPNALVSRSFEHYTEKKIAVDTSIFLSKFLSSGVLSQCYPGTSHLYGIYYLARFLLGGNVFGLEDRNTPTRQRKSAKRSFRTLPVFVFDGTQRCEAKQLFELERRAEVRQRNTVQLECEQNRLSLMEHMLDWNEKFQGMPLRLRIALSRRLDCSLRMAKKLSPLKNPLSQQLELKFQELVKSHEILLKVATGQRVPNLERQMSLLQAICNPDVDCKPQLDSYLASSTKQVTLMQGRNVRITSIVASESQQLLKALGIPYTVAPPKVEAEAYCAALTTHGITSATLTEDTDASFFGDGLVLHKLNYASNGRSSVLEVNPTVARNTLQLSKDQYIDLAILMGCDFSETIKGIGPHTALKLIQEHESIENIIVNMPHLSASQFDGHFKNARQILRNKVTPLAADENPQRSVVDEERLLNLLKRKGLTRLVSSFHKDKLLAANRPVQATSQFPDLDGIYDSVLKDAAGES